MSIGKTTASGAAMALAIWSAPASAQDAAESAIILGGTGEATGAASRRMGEATRGAIGGAANAINAAQRGRGRAGRYDGANVRPSGGGRSPGGVEGYRIPAGIDALDGTDARQYQLGTGSTLRVSGGFTPSETTFCISYCFDDMP